ncbi:MAG TPA: polyhydroxyalkanoate depolymerase, partial [Bradyrhizobium sp.]|nr:polyhydroxyalkanoate depolymerase [Bradyrhizobium sp.]
EAAHRLCPNIPSERKAHWLQPGVGHYGVFNGSRFRSEIVPRISDFVLSNNSSARNTGRRPIKSKLALEASNDLPHAASGAAALKVAGK